MDSCIFCKIIHKKIPSHIIYEDEDILAILPKEVEVYGHTLVIPKIHYENIYDISEDILAKLMLVAKKLATQYKQTIQSTGINIIHAAGKDAQQSVAHFHLHLLPRFKDDGLDTRPKLEHLEDNKDLMLKRLRGEDI